MIAIIQRGHPQEVKEKRILRIKEAINFETGTKGEPQKHIIGKINDNEIYFMKPGKEFFRENNQNINDMKPYVGDSFDNYTFGDIWKDLLNLSIRMSEDSYKKLNTILYRLAYLMDCTKEEGKVRFSPSENIKKIIEEIQEEINLKGYAFNMLEFLNFVDILSWNEDVKYQSDCIFDNPKKGRINTVLSLISIPLIFKKFVDLVIENKDNLENLDYSILIDSAQSFARTRGVQPISNKELIKYLNPYLSE